MRIRIIVWNVLANLYPCFLCRLYGIKYGKNVKISYRARQDKSVIPVGIFIGENTWILANSCILSHDSCIGKNGTTKKLNAHSGKNYVIGVNSIVRNGVNIGDEVIVASGAIVTKDVISNCIVAGNPAKIIKEGIHIDNKGQLIYV